MKITNYLAHGMLCSTIALLAACGGETESPLSDAPVSSGQASLTLNITDAPVDEAKAVVMEFTGVSIKAADQKDELDFEFDEPKSIDLLKLQGSSFEKLLDGIDLPAGDYKWVRLRANAEKDQVLDSYIELEDGTMRELHIPSADKAGLKIKSDFTLVEGEASEHTIDFDLRKSLRFAKGDDAAMVKPSLRMVNNKHSGHMSGFIGGGLMSEACADDEKGAVYVYAGADVVPSDYSGADTDPIASSLVNDGKDGHKYGVGFLEKGEYTIAYTCDAALDTPDAVESLVFLSTATINLKAKTSGRSDFHSKGGMHSGRSDGRKGQDGMMSEGRHTEGLSKEGREAKQSKWNSLSEEERAAMQAEWEAKFAEHKAGRNMGGNGMKSEERAAWDALTEEEKAAKKAEHEAKRAAQKAEHDAKKAEWEAEVAAKKAEWEALTDEEKAAIQAEKKAEHEAKRAEWDAKRAEEKAAWDAERAAWNALTDEEKAAKKAEKDAEHAAKRAEHEAERAAWEALSDEEKKAAREAKKAEYEAARKTAKKA